MIKSARVITSNQFSGTSSADYMVVQEYRCQAIGWIFVTENGQYDARQWNEMPVGIFTTLDEAAVAIAEVAES